MYLVSVARVSGVRVLDGVRVEEGHNHDRWRGTRCKGG
jgi:hypothetical protein